MASSVGADTAVDLFTGTTRVAQEFKRRGLTVTASDIATYSEVLSDCYIATDAAAVDLDEVREVVACLPPTELMYLDPPYNQHRYFTNYHVWETLVRWDEPEPYGVARKRIDSRDDTMK